MMTQSQFDTLEYEHYWYMFEEYNHDEDYEDYGEDNEEDDDSVKTYCVDYTYEESLYEYSYQCRAWDQEDAENEFWKAVKSGRITKGIPENMEDIEILDIWVVA